MFRVPPNIITGYSEANFSTGKKIPDHVHHPGQWKGFLAISLVRKKLVYTCWNKHIMGGVLSTTVNNAT